MKTCYAIYRKPEERGHCYFVEADRALPITLEQMDSRRGFVVAPFDVTADTPRVIIEGEARTTDIDLAQAATGNNHPATAPMPQPEQAERADYHDRFAVFHTAISEGRLTKVILSRCSRETLSEQKEPMTLFRHACAAFPHCFIALFHTPMTGTWLTATPEILLEENGGRAHTMALAGTMAAPGNAMPTQAWSEKNRREQQYVADYIRERLALPDDRLSVTAAHTFVAGNVAHLRSDFAFSLSDIGSIGETIRRLHPTPAVCGLPTEAARQFILAHEGHPRAYYSGYCGPLRQQGTHLFVMLRCMHICSNRYDLYAGGGLVSESTEEEEWQETEAKLYAMRATLAQTPL